MPLDQKTLEDILIARSLGTLSPEADILLSDYLERNPKDGHLANRYREVVSLAGKVLASKNQVTLPPFPAKVLRETCRKRGWRIPLKDSLSWAACLVIGFSMGMVITNSSSPPELKNEQPVTVFPALKKETFPESKTSFWSVRLSARPSAESRERKGLRLIWKSPVEKPSIGG